MYVPLRLAEHLASAVREHFVRVHVVRRAGAGLIDVDDELIAERAGEDLVGGGARSRSAMSGVEAAERGVGFGRGFLDEDGGGDEIGGRAKAADRKVLDGARGLHAVVRVGGNVELAQRIGSLRNSASADQPASALSQP